MANDYHPVATLDEWANGTMKMVKIEERQILLARDGDKVYATQNRCPHMRGNLSRGKLEGCIVICPAHGKRYDLSNGHTVGLMSNNPLTRRVSGFFSGGGLATYPVKIDGTQIMVMVKKPAAA